MNKTFTLKCSPIYASVLGPFSYPNMFKMDLEGEDGGCAKVLLFPFLKKRGCYRLLRTVASDNNVNSISGLVLAVLTAARCSVLPS